MAAAITVPTQAGASESDKQVSKIEITIGHDSAITVRPLGLVIKGAPPGMPVGPHLAQLAGFFPGYSVTYGGAMVGAAYASLFGGALGFVLAAVWNFAHSLVLAVIRVQASLATYSID